MKTGISISFFLRAMILYMVLHVEKANKRAHELYRKCGYSDYEDQGKRIMMVKELRK